MPMGGTGAPYMNEYSLYRLVGAGREGLSWFVWHPVVHRYG